MNNFTIIADNLLITFIDFKVIIAKYYTMQFIFAVYYKYQQSTNTVALIC